MRRLLTNTLTITALTAVAVLAACDVNPRQCASQRDCFGGEVCASGECVARVSALADAGDAGAEPDSDSPRDCRLDEAVCGAQVCNVSTGRCEACQRDIQCGDGGLCDKVAGECTCGPGFHACGGTCLPDTSVDSCGDLCEPCPTVPNAEATCTDGVCGHVCEEAFIPCDGCGFEPLCVECLGNAECQKNEASRCDAGLCAECESDGDCAHLDNNVCDAGVCVECTSTKRQACGTNSCDPALRTCTSTGVGSLEWCEACVADSECPANHKCVPMSFRMAQREGGFCLEVANNTCLQPTPLTVQRNTLSGIADEYFCVFREDIMTCESHLSFDRRCDEDDDCGNPDLGDAKCRLNNAIRVCTIPCVDREDCPGGFTCVGNPPDNSYCTEL